ncbi:MAG: BrnT family toxin [Truepera sp.]|nr:BrnT family toxin [Truepera sp.]
MEFEWSEAKAASNLVKHQVGFEEAKTVFDNPLAVIFDDERRSTDERREIIVGHSHMNRLLLVSFTERAPAIRIISARLATRKERKAYEANALP